MKRWAVVILLGMVLGCAVAGNRLLGSNPAPAASESAEARRTREAAELRHMQCQPRHWRNSFVHH